MGETWVSQPKNRDKVESLEVIIEERRQENGFFVQYNGIHVDRMHEFPNLKGYARDFCTKFFKHGIDERVTFTDSHGARVDSTNPEAIFFSFEDDDLDEIEKNIRYLANCCANPDSGINMTVHLEGTPYDIVSDKDNREYISDFGDKGISVNHINELMEAIREIKSKHHTM